MTIKPFSGRHRLGRDIALVSLGAMWPVVPHHSAILAAPLSLQLGALPESGK